MQFSDWLSTLALLVSGGAIFLSYRAHKEVMQANEQAETPFREAGNCLENTGLFKILRDENLDMTIDMFARSKPNHLALLERDKALIKNALEDAKGLQKKLDRAAKHTHPSILNKHI